MVNDDHFVFQDHLIILHEDPVFIMSEGRRKQYDIREMASTLLKNSCIVNFLLLHNLHMKRGIPYSWNNAVKTSFKSGNACPASITGEQGGLSAVG